MSGQHMLVPCNIITRQHLMEYIEEYKSIERFFKNILDLSMIINSDGSSVASYLGRYSSKVGSYGEVPVFTVVFVAP